MREHLSIIYSPCASPEETIILFHVSIFVSFVSIFFGYEISAVMNTV
jgi:hypothetical protein